MDAELLISDDHETMSLRAAMELRAMITRAIAERSRAVVALSGGSTPRRLYELLGDAALEWSAITWIMADERLVAFDDPERSSRMIRELLGARITTLVEPNASAEPDLEAAALAYEHALAEVLGEEGRIDVVLLGMGGDGHTASLFPEDLDRPQVPGRRVVAVLGPERRPPRERVSLSYEAIHAARVAMFLVSGQGKRETLSAIWSPQGAPHLPAYHVRAERVIWCVDQAAAPQVG